MSPRKNENLEEILLEEKRNPPGLGKAIRKFGVIKTAVFILAMAFQLPYEYFRHRVLRKRR